MNDDKNLPIVHAWLFYSVLLGCVFMLVLMLTACGSAPVLTEIKIPVPVECKETVPDRPTMPTEQFTDKPSLDQYVRAARAEIKRREGYEVELRTALEACTAPIN